MSFKIFSEKCFPNKNPTKCKKPNRNPTKCENPTKNPTKIQQKNPTKIQQYENPTPNKGRAVGLPTPDSKRVKMRRQ